MILYLTFKIKQTEKHFSHVSDKVSKDSFVHRGRHNQLKVKVSHEGFKF